MRYLKGLLLIIFFLPMAAFSGALIPLENLLMGQRSSEWQRTFESLHHFGSDSTDSRDQLLSYYQNYYLSSLGLEQRCSSSSASSLQFSELASQHELERSMLATLQYLGLDLVIRALISYAKYFEFSEDEFLKLTHFLVDGHCSENLTVISKRQLRNNMLEMFKSFDPEFSFMPSLPADFNLPSIAHGMSPEDDYRKKEFLVTIRLFKSFCSWPGEVENLRLLVPLVRNPQVMSYVIEQLDGKRWHFDTYQGAQLKASDNTVAVLCRGILCRRVSQRDFLSQRPRSLGSISLRDDLERLYCQRFRDQNFYHREMDPRISQMINDWSEGQQALMVSQFLSLITGIADLSLRAPRLSDLMMLSEASVDHFWQQWAEQRLENIIEQGPRFHEQLAIRAHHREEAQLDPFELHFDVDYGEFDRVYQKVGKLTLGMSALFYSDFLEWLIKNRRDALAPIHPSASDLAVIEQTQERLIRHLQHALLDQYQKLAHPPVKFSEFVEVVAQEILRRIDSDPSVFYQQLLQQIEKRPVDVKSSQLTTQLQIKLHFAPFALKEMTKKRHHQKAMELLNQDYRNNRDRDK